LNPGNRTFEGDWTATPSQCSSAANPNVRSSSTTALSNNQVSGYFYDAAGNVTNDGVNQYLYDAEGRICAVASTPVAGLTAMTGYIYDAEGTRVAKGAITTWSCDPAISGFTTTNDYIIGPSGEQMTEMGMGGVTANGTTAGLTWQHTNAWAGGKLLATYDNDGLHFYLDDPLGSRRVQTDYEGVVERTCASLPFGDVETCAPTPTEHLFTGKERDNESGNDYFGARYYASSMGRFLSPDWSAKVEPVPYAKLDNPQSLNLYAFVGNNPLSRIDADGHLTIIVPGTWNKHKDWDNSGFKAQVSKTFGENAVVLNNGGMDNTPKARADAAKQLEGLIAGHQFAPGEKLNIVTHSHGGNVAAEATQEGLSHKVDTLVTLGVPVRSDYTFNESVIGQHLNVFSNNDNVQPMGGRETTAWSPWGGNVDYAQPAGRTVNLPGVRNLDATSTASGHSDLWQSPGTWDKIVAPEIK
jgi:RHS repeat-associated protein